MFGMKNIFVHVVFMWAHVLTDLGVLYYRHIFYYRYIHVSFDMSRFIIGTCLYNYR